MTPPDAQHLPTAAARGDRFSNGHVESDFDSRFPFQPCDLTRAVDRNLESKSDSPFEMAFRRMPATAVQRTANRTANHDSKRRFDAHQRKRCSGSPNRTANHDSKWHFDARQRRAHSGTANRTANHDSKLRFDRRQPGVCSERNLDSDFDSRFPFQVGEVPHAQKRNRESKSDSRCPFEKRLPGRAGSCDAWQRAKWGQARQTGGERPHVGNERAIHFAR